MKYKWKQTLIAMLLAAAMMLSLPAAVMAEGSAPAPEALDLTKSVTLTIAPGPATMTGSAHPHHIPAANVVYDLYLVAEPVKETNYDSYHYSLCTDFDGITPDISSYDALAAMTVDSWHQLATAAAKKLFAYDTLPAAAVTGNPCGTAMTLSCGLYLVIAHSDGMTKDEYVKEEGEDVFTIARSDEYEYTYAPELISLPASAAAIPAYFPGDTPESYNTSGSHWYYTVSAMLKPTEEMRYGDLVIEKDLPVYEDSSPVSFVFRVQGYKKDDDGNEFSFDDYYMITFSAAEKKSLTLTELFPVGMSILVTEVYSGAGYAIVGSSSVGALNSTTFVIKPKDIDPATGSEVTPLTASFVNKYDGKLLQGGGILNEYAFEKLSETDPGEWKLTAPTTIPAVP